jgi:FeS assembly protein SufD
LEFLVNLSSFKGNNVEEIASIRNNPSWLKELRVKAFEKYSSLPDEFSNLYSKYTDATRLRTNDIKIDIEIVPHEPYKDLSDRLKNIEKECSLIFLDSGLHQQYISKSILDKGIIVSEINDAFLRYPDTIRKYIENESAIDDKYLALEISSFQTGLFVYVPKNTVLEEPIRMITALTDNESAVYRNLFVVESNSIVTVNQEFYSSNDNTNTGVTNRAQRALFEHSECHVSNNANLEIVTLQALGSNTASFSNRKSFVDSDGKISWYLGLFGADVSRYKTDSYMIGQGSSAEDVGITFGVGNQSFDVSSNLIHIGRNTRGKVLSKAVMKDTAKSLFKGMIKIGKDAKSSESYLAGHSILLNKGAKSDAIPGLEIETNEVRATHAASVSQIDESPIFYLMSRGLSREGAKREIVNGFLEPLSRKMGPIIRAYINYLIESKWEGKSLMLRTDEAMEQILEVEKSRYRETEDIFEKHYKYR